MEKRRESKLDTVVFEKDGVPETRSISLAESDKHTVISITLKH